MENGLRGASGPVPPNIPSVTFIWWETYPSAEQWDGCHPKFFLWKASSFYNSETKNFILCTLNHKLFNYLSNKLCNRQITITALLNCVHLKHLTIYYLLTKVTQPNKTCLDFSFDNIIKKWLWKNDLSYGSVPNSFYLPSVALSSQEL